MAIKIVPLRIAIYHTTLPEPGRKPGGVEVTVHRLANELAKDGRNNVTVLSLSPAPPDARYNHVQLFARTNRLRHWRAIRLFVLPFLLNFVRLGDFDVLHIHGDDWFFVNRAIPSVRTLHGSALEEARHATSLKRKVVQYLVYPLEHLSVFLATVALAVGSATAKIYGLTALANNGVDLGRFSPGSKTDYPSVLFVGTWHGRKRGQFIYKTFVNEILPAVPNSKLYMVSDYCDEHEHVSWICNPTDEVLSSLYQQSWVFAYPSIYEGFGIPYVEAMASGTAIISSDNPGARDVLLDGKYGVLCDDISFGSKVVSMLNKQERRRHFEELGLERARDFEWVRVTEEHEAAYTFAINHFRKPVKKT